MDRLRGLLAERGNTIKGASDRHHNLTTKKQFCAGQPDLDEVEIAAKSDFIEFDRGCASLYNSGLQESPAVRHVGEGKESHSP